MQSFTNILDSFKGISLQELDHVQLMNRIDTKFAFSTEQLFDFLTILQTDYNVLELENTRVHRYESLYFDDEQFSFFKDHHNGKTDRFKVRIRKYVESNVYFLEIKHKIKGRTYKERIPAETFDTIINKTYKEFLVKQLQEDKELVPTMWNSFQRITLASKTLNERVTLDFNINFHYQETERQFDHLVIAELKQENLNRNSPFYLLMKENQIRSYHLSKYCIGSMEIYGEEKLKFNRFKKKLLFLNKIAKNAT